MQREKFSRIWLAIGLCGCAIWAGCVPRTHAPTVDIGAEITALRISASGQPDVEPADADSEGSGPRVIAPASAQYLTCTLLVSAFPERLGCTIDDALNGNRLFNWFTTFQCGSKGLNLSWLDARLSYLFPGTPPPFGDFSLTMDTTIVESSCAIELAATNSEERREPDRHFFLLHAAVGEVQDVRVFRIFDDILIEVDLDCQYVTEPGAE